MPGCYAACWRAQRMNPQYISHARFSTHRAATQRTFLYALAILVTFGDFQVSRPKSRGDAEIGFVREESFPVSSARSDMAFLRAPSVIVLVAAQLLLVVEVSSSAVPHPSATEGAKPAFALVGRRLQSSPSLGSNSVSTANLAAGTTSWTLTTSTSLMYVAVLSTWGDAKTIQSFTCGASPTAQVYNTGSSNYVTAGANPAWFYGYGAGLPSQQGWVSMGSSTSLLPAPPAS